MEKQKKRGAKRQSSISAVGIGGKKIEGGRQKDNITLPAVGIGSKKKRGGSKKIYPLPAVGMSGSFLLL